MNRCSECWPYGHFDRRRRLENVMQQFLQRGHQLPIALSHFARGQRVAKASRVCTHCGSVAVADELH